MQCFFPKLNPLFDIKARKGKTLSEKKATSLSGMYLYLD